MRLGNVPKITELRLGSTEMSGNLPDITQLRTGSTEVREPAQVHTAQMWKHRDVQRLA